MVSNTIFNVFCKKLSFDQMWDLGPLIYCRNTSKVQENPKSSQIYIYIYIYIYVCKSGNLESLFFWNTCANIVEILEFGIYKLEMVKHWNINFEISKLWHCLWTCELANIKSLKFMKLQNFEILKLWKLKKWIHDTYNI